MLKIFISKQKIIFQRPQICNLGVVSGTLGAVGLDYVQLIVLSSWTADANISQHIRNMNKSKR